jgi:hypothetical membrane protein
MSTFGQDSITRIKASSELVDIRVGNDYFLKQGWKLDLKKNPDVFFIGSKWVYKSKKVTFITNIDSISIITEPGNKYNFIIDLNDTAACHIQIRTLSNPVFLNKSILIPVLSGITIILLLLFLYKRKLNTILLLSFGYVSLMLFWITTIVSGFIHGNYNHLRNVISELGAIESKSEIITSASLILLSVICILFTIGFYKASRTFKISVIPALLSLSMPLSIFWAAVFPLGNEFHGSVGPLPILTLIGALLAFILWSKNHEFFKLRLLSLISCFVMLLLLLRFIKPFAFHYEGLIQRFFYLGWSIWIISVSYYFTRKLKNKQVDTLLVP